MLARVCSQPARVRSRPVRGRRFECEGAEDARRARRPDKRISIDRVVRVACPARGTLLASKRLDAYVSVVKWALELAQIPVAPQLVDFLGEVARRRADPDKVPGLAAQIPDSPLISWLHAADKPIKGDLRVVAGDLEGDSVVSPGSRPCCLTPSSGPTTIWSCRRDRCMADRPARRIRRSFSTKAARSRTSTTSVTLQTASAVVNALALTADPPDGFRVIGPLSWAGQSSTGVRAALPSRPRGRSRRVAGALHPAGNARQQSEGRQRSHLAGMAPRQWLRPARLRSEGRPMSRPTGRSAFTTTTCDSSSSTTTT